MNSPILTLDRVSMRFGGLVANRDVSFTASAGEVTALIGPNGAGKTTLFNCITGFYQASSGRIVLHGDGGKEDAKQGGQPRDCDIGALIARPLSGGSHQAARHGIARTFQNIRLFRDMSAVENLLVAQHRATVNQVFAGVFQTRRFRAAESRAIERAWFWLEQLHLAEDGNRLAGQLPYGKQRRLEIARAMCTAPRLICLDEPAAGLNPAETEELAAIIQTLQHEHQVSVMLIEHDMRLVMQISQHIIVLDHGEVIADGTPDEVARNPAVIAAYLGETDATEVTDATGETADGGKESS